MITRTGIGAATQLALAISVAACVGDSTTAGLDAGGDATPDAAADVSATDVVVDHAVEAGATSCEITKTFTAPKLVQGLPQTGGDLRLSPSELTAYYAINTVDAGLQIDLFTATRATINDAFSNITPISGLNTARNDFAPTVDATETTMIFARSGPYALFVATRPSTSAAFTSDAPLAGPLGTETTTGIRDPYLSADSTTLLYVDAPQNLNHLFQSTFAGGNYGTGTVLTELTTASGEYRPVLSADFHSIYWTSARSDLGAQGGIDIFMASRVGATGAFGSIRNVTELNTSGNDSPGWISPDNCRLYFQRDDGMYVASRPAP